MPLPIANTSYVIASGGDPTYRLQLNGGNYIDCIVFEGHAQTWRVVPIAGAVDTFAIFHEESRHYVSRAPNDARVEVNGAGLGGAEHFVLANAANGAVTIKSAVPGNNRLWTVGDNSMIYMRAPNAAASQAFKFVQA